MSRWGMLICLVLFAYLLVRRFSIQTGEKPSALLLDSPGNSNRRSLKVYWLKRAGMQLDSPTPPNSRLPPLMLITFPLIVLGRLDSYCYKSFKHPPLEANRSAFLAPLISLHG